MHIVEKSEGNPPLLKRGAKFTEMNHEKKERILKIAGETLDIEARALMDLKASLNQSFVDVVDLILNLPGRLVVTGIGKSAIVGQKIVATLNSTGTPSLFMHAADAIHGDLGMIRSDDAVLCLSKSGDTPEIKVLLPLLKHRIVALIGMVSKAESYLARQADLVLLTPIDQEADPNNLAPTTSTTSQMALGDALATALLDQRGFSSQDFARFHPGGSLGKQLYLRVSDLYPANEKPVVSPSSSIRETILEMTSKRLGAAVVVDGDRLVGIITDGDLRRMLEKEQETRHLRAEEIMTRAPKTVQADDLAVHALEVMRGYNITQIPVCQGETYVGMIHLHDLIREGLI